MNNSLPSFSRLVALLPTALALGCGAPVDGESTSNQTESETVTVRRGVDSAGAFSASDAKILRKDYGVTWTGVYIGGKCSGGFGWSRSVVTAIANAAGFEFMPTYVGQEAPQSCNLVKPVLTQAQGVADAHDTATKMAEFGWGAKKNIPVSLDIEQDTFEYSAAGTAAYVRGWVNEIRSLGYLPYVYANPDTVNYLVGQKIDIAGVWVASYFYNGFANVTPADLHQIGSNFSHHDRAWQYAGGVYLSSIGTHVDCDTSDLLLAPAPGGSNSSGGSSSSSSTGSPPPAAPDACSEGNGFCTETLQCDGGHWIVRQDDPHACTTVENVKEACHEGNGYCTATLQCDGGYWVPRTSDPASCTAGPGA
jgi:hypothetical protein